MSSKSPGSTEPPTAVPPVCFADRGTLRVRLFSLENGRMRSGSGSVRGTGIQSHGLSTLYLGSATALRLADDWLAEPGVGEVRSARVP